MSRLNEWRMTRLATSPDLDPVLSLTEARQHLRVDAFGSPLPEHEDDTLVRSYVQAAINELDGIDGWLGRALVTQSWRLTLDYFPASPIKLPLPPFQSLTAITYVDGDGAEQTLPAAAYRVISSDSDPAQVEPAFGTSWPATRDQSGAVSITYVCGYGEPADVPELIRNYIRVRLGQFYEQRELVAMALPIQPVPFLRESLESFRRRVRPI
jgi:uncharacterized phiE125 gp8 family phage protein